MELYKINIKQDKKVVVKLFGEYVQKFIFNKLEQDSLSTTRFKIEKVNQYLELSGFLASFKLIAVYNQSDELVKVVKFYSNKLGDSDKDIEEEWNLIRQLPLDIALLDKLVMPDDILYDESADS